MPMELAQTAREQLAAKLQGLRVSDETDDVCFRLSASERGEPQLMLSRPRPGDVTFEQDDRVIFAVASDVAPQFAQRTLDLRANEHGAMALVAYPTPE